jgi:lipopolysaccharide/colanic/teichoic acid biosynthesis glycosyltransferase
VTRAGTIPRAAPTPFPAELERSAIECCAARDASAHPIGTSAESLEIAPANLGGHQGYHEIVESDGRRRLKTVRRSYDRCATPGTAIRPRRRIGKRTFSVFVSVMGLLLTAPLFPVIMLAIWLEDGRPFFFGHQRQTRGGRSFRCYKFRTMCREAETMKSCLTQRNICDGPQFHIEQDPRLLRVGRVLRKLHMDELPQFYNVLVGDMDIVGPRPSPDGENQFCPTWRETRLSIRPGITGLWQVARTRAPNVDFQEWIRYDLEYVRREDWRLDLWILWRTFRSLLRRVGKLLDPSIVAADQSVGEDASTTEATQATGLTDARDTPNAPVEWTIRLVGTADDADVIAAESPSEDPAIRRAA